MTKTHVPQVITLKSHDSLICGLLKITTDYDLILRHMIDCQNVVDSVIWERGEGWCDKRIVSMEHFQHMIFYCNTATNYE